MSLWSSSNASDAVGQTVPEVQAGHVLSSSSSDYSVIDFIGEGCFSKVARCQNVATQETVAMKIIKDTRYIQDTQREVSMLELLGVFNPDHINIVRFSEWFQHKGLACLAFEMLDGSLYDLLEERDWKPLSLNEIRPIAQQLLVALDALRDVGVLHTDIHPGNIMFVNRQDQTLRVKLIDFSEAIPASKTEPGMELQPTGFRAPEIALGLPFNHPIDVWGVGCVLAFLYLAENLFSVHCDYQMIKSMVDVLGQPEDHLLRAGRYTKCFFREVEEAEDPAWRLMTPEEYEGEIDPEEPHSFIDLPSCLDDLVNIYPEGEATETEDRRKFVELLKKLLHLDGDQRISALQGLQEPFIVMSHVTAADSRADLTTSWEELPICPVDHSEDGGNRTSDQQSPAVLDVRHPPSAVSHNPHATRSLIDSSDEDQAGWDSEGEIPSFPGDKLSAGWFSEEDLPANSFEEDPAAFPSDSASTGPSDTALKKIQRFFRRITNSFCCCWCSAVKD